MKVRVRRRYCHLESSIRIRNKLTLSAHVPASGPPISDAPKYKSESGRCHRWIARRYKDDPTRTKLWSAFSVSGSSNFATLDVTRPPLPCPRPAPPAIEASKSNDAKLGFDCRAAEVLNVLPNGEEAADPERGQGGSPTRAEGISLPSLIHLGTMFTEPSPCEYSHNSAHRFRLSTHPFSQTAPLKALFLQRVHLGKQRDRPASVSLRWQRLRLLSTE